MPAQQADAMSRMIQGGAKSDLMTPDEINAQRQVLGKQIWRVIPYAKKYPKRVIAGILGNFIARIFDLMPFVAIGFAVDYFTTNSMVGPQIFQDMILAINPDPAYGYGFLIFLGFFCLAIFQGISEYAWHTLG